MARKQFSSEFKTKVALEALKGEKTIAQLSSEYGVRATQINILRVGQRGVVADRGGEIKEEEENKGRML